MHFVRGAYTPEQERAWHEEKTYGEWPQTLFGFHHSVVASRQSDGEPVTEAAGEEGAVAISWFIIYLRTFLKTHASIVPTMQDR